MTRFLLILSSCMSKCSFTRLTLFFVKLADAPLPAALSLFSNCKRMWHEVCTQQHRASTRKTTTQRRIFTLYVNNRGDLNDHCKESKVKTRLVFGICCFIVLCHFTSCSMSLMNSPCFECPSTSFLALCRCSCRTLYSSGLALKTSRQISQWQDKTEWSDVNRGLGLGSCSQLTSIHLLSSKVQMTAWDWCS